MRAAATGGPRRVERLPACLGAALPAGERLQTRLLLLYYILLVRSPQPADMPPTKKASSMRGFARSPSASRGAASARPSRAKSPARRPRCEVATPPALPAAASPLLAREYYYNGTSLRPYMRGWLHLFCAATSPVWGTALLIHCQSARAVAAAAVYVLGATYLFAVSGTFHMYQWQSQAAEDWIRKADYVGKHPQFAMSLGFYRNASHFQECCGCLQGST